MDDSSTSATGTGLGGRRIVLGVTGGIAAYKAAELCRLFVKAGATVRVVMTEAATRFIAPLTLQTLSAAPVGLDLFDPASEAEIGHIKLADEADLLVVAPATADFIARMPGWLDATCWRRSLATRPGFAAPAMNVNMWTNPVTQANLAVAGGASRPSALTAASLLWLDRRRRCGAGDIVTAAAGLLAGGPDRRNDLAGRRVVVGGRRASRSTACVSRQPIVGKMGAALAEAAAALRRGRAAGGRARHAGGWARAASTSDRAERALPISRRAPTR
jgi:phosphopantothenoylcysteine decarboxylase/phosphopantothenate--cysteine ligase